MIFNSSGEGCPSPSSCSSLRRKDALFDSKAKAEKTKNCRRKRMEIRKTKSVAEERTFGDQTGSFDSDDCSKKKRRGIIENETESTEEEKIDRVENDVGSSMRGVTCRGHGNVSLIGRRREMEDTVAVELGFLNRGRREYDFFGIYDGQGGRRVAQECSEMLHKLLVMISGDETGEEINWGKLMAEGFKKMDEEVNKYDATVATTGSTAVVAVVGEEVIVVANCGDSRAVLFCGGAALPLSDDHKPDKPDELERIEVSGGRVINWNGHRVLGVLATSRSIGDHYLKPFVITEPEVKVINRTDKDEFLILASDGLWDVVSNDLACQVIRRCLDGRFKKSSKTSKAKEDSERDHQLDETENESQAARAAAVLAELAMARGSRDNISVIVVKLKQGRSGSFSSHQG